MMKIVICAYTDMTRKPAERSAWGENKERYSIFVTPTAMKAIDTRAEALDISRSEFLEKFARQMVGMTDIELAKEEREALTKSFGAKRRSSPRRTWWQRFVPQAQG
jgi:hypothetical protein